MLSCVVAFIFFVIPAVCDFCDTDDLGCQWKVVSLVGDHSKANLVHLDIVDTVERDKIEPDKAELDKADKAEPDTRIWAVDLARTVQKSAYGSLTGSSYTEIAAKINRYAATHPSVRKVIPCHNLDANAVALLASELKPFIDLDVQLGFPPGDNRLVETNPWKIRGYRPASQARRDAQCSEAMKLWAHYIPNKNSSMRVVLPSLPVSDSEGEEGEAAFYTRSWSIGHSVVDVVWKGPNFHADIETDGAIDWPHWPTVTHFHGKAHGAYPFWQFDQTQRMLLREISHTPSFYHPGTDVEAWFTANATRFRYSSCHWALLGLQELENGPCVELQSHSDGTSFLFTEDDSFCCTSMSIKKQGMHLATLDRNFINNMKYVGEVEFVGDYYKGPAKRFVMASNVSARSLCPTCYADNFLSVSTWYETDIYGRPLRFGEFGEDFQLKDEDLEADLPFMYADLNPESFLSLTRSSFLEFLFNTPKVCQTNAHGCHVENAESNNTLMR